LIQISIPCHELFPFHIQRDREGIIIKWSAGGDLLEKNRLTTLFELSVGPTKVSALPLRVAGRTKWPVVTAFSLSLLWTQLLNISS
jgi:hypothetical protein